MGKHQIDTLNAEFYKSVLCVQQQTPNNACRAELGRYPLIIEIQKRALTFYNHLKESDTDILHNKNLDRRETLERSTLSQLILRLYSQAQAETPDRNPVRLNQIVRKQKENYLTNQLKKERKNQLKTTANWNATWP